eukprot:scaffold12861_cov134-Isochrysis_galbana.AAC.6
MPTPQSRAPMPCAPLCGTDAGRARIPKGGHTGEGRLHPRLFFCCLSSETAQIGAGWGSKGRAWVVTRAHAPHLQDV